MATDARTYAVVSGAYWAFMLTDGALRMLVLLHFHTLGYTPFQLAFLFVLYELMGVGTNLVGGWLGARFGLTLTLHAGLALQVVAVLLLSLLDPTWATLWAVAWVVAAQGLSGVAKDLTKMSAKSAIKGLVAEGALFRWVAFLTGSKNAVKGLGFFVGGAALAALGFAPSLYAMAGLLIVVMGIVGLLVPGGLGKAKAKLPFRRILSKSRAINLLSSARFFLFGARDIWFVVGLPIFLYDVLGWTFPQVGGFLAAWVIGYGFVQAVSPAVMRRAAGGALDEVRAARVWVGLLAAVPPAMVAALWLGAAPGAVLIGGLGVFGVLFAVNSALHSYLILAYSEGDSVAADVGFYYMANAAGRLVGTLLSGAAYQLFGIVGCLLGAALMLLLSATLVTRLPRQPSRDLAS